MATWYSAKDSAKINIYETISEERMIWHYHICIIFGTLKLFQPYIKMKNIMSVENGKKRRRKNVRNLFRFF